MRRQEIDEGAHLGWLLFAAEVIDVQVGGNGHTTMPDLVGIGFEGKSNLYSETRELSD